MQVNFLSHDLKDHEMQQPEKFVTALGVIVVLSHLSPVMAADATQPAVAGPEGQSHHHSASPLKLTEEQLDKISAGMDWASVGVLALRAAEISRNYDSIVDLGHVVICDEGWLCKVY